MPRLRLHLVALALTFGFAAAAPASPNIVLFLVDDLGWQDLSVPMHTQPTEFNARYHTPNLDRLARRGMRFTQAYASAPVCTPTRTSILSGASPARSHISYWTLHRDRDTSRAHPTVRPPAWNMNGLQPAPANLPRLLANAGYRTIHVGKAHFGAHGTDGADPTRLGFEVNIAGHGSGAPASFYGTHGFSRAGRSGNPEATSVWDVPGLEKYHGRDIYLTEALALEADAAVRTALDEGVPFFLNFAPYAVHTPIMANRRRLDRYAALDPKEAAYATMIESADAALGTIMDTLEERGAADRTVIIFTSDNGGLSAHARGGVPHTHNAPLKSGKGSSYEGGTRVPAIIAWPGVTKPDSVCHEPVISHDLYPTILAIAGVAMPVDHAEDVDGVDLGPLVRGTRVGFPVGRVLGWHQPHQWGASGPGIEPFTSIRADRWKLIYFHGDRRFELYDLQTDLGERFDRAASEPAMVAALADRMDRWIRHTGAQLSLHKDADAPIPGPVETLAARD
ncbi:MAG: sulfatase [Phycisphaerales bacterium]|nr:sulfatase [Phycisphaerae bacterium]NNM24416.1 sulfatase [Phycisphaerales bacterium]